MRKSDSLHYFTDGRDIVLTEQHLSLDDTLACGQAFRWEPVAQNAYRGIAGGRCLFITQSGERFRLMDTTEEDFLSFWANYFDLHTDYGVLKAAFSRDPVLARACAYAGGMRVLRQDPWEALCSFILSQNNNIPRIKGLVARLCAHFGECVQSSVRTFPAPEVLAELTEEELAPVRAGFRAKYILDAARKVASGDLLLDDIDSLPFQEARESLMRIHGVGPKVAECALLYGFHRLEAFPMDVWMKRAMAHFYPNGLPECAKKAPGIAQQYLFHYIRTCPDAIGEELAMGLSAR